MWRTEQFHPENRFSGCWDITRYMRGFKLRSRTYGLRYSDASHESTWNYPHNRGRYYYDLSQCITTRAIQKLENANRPWVIHLSGLLAECPRPLPYLIANMHFSLNLLSQPLSPTRWDDIRLSPPAVVLSDGCCHLLECFHHRDASRWRRPSDRTTAGRKDEYPLI
jgi:hypothetical protein